MFSEILDSAFFYLVSILTIPTRSLTLVNCVRSKFIVDLPLYDPQLFIQGHRSGLNTSIVGIVFAHFPLFCLQLHTYVFSCLGRVLLKLPSLAQSVLFVIA